jgi:predicted metal-binding membrane protein
MDTPTVLQTKFGLAFGFGITLFAIFILNTAILQCRYQCDAGIAVAPVLLVAGFFSFCHQSHALWKQQTTSNAGYVVLKEEKDKDVSTETSSSTETPPDT